MVAFAVVRFSTSPRIPRLTRTDNDTQNDTQHTTTKTRKTKTTTQHGTTRRKRHNGTAHTRKYEQTNKRTTKTTNTTTTTDNNKQQTTATAGLVVAKHAFKNYPKEQYASIILLSESSDAQKLITLRCTSQRCSEHVERVPCAVLPSSPVRKAAADISCN